MNIKNKILFTSLFFLSVTLACNDAARKVENDNNKLSADLVKNNQSLKNDNKEKTLRYFQISSYTSDKHYEMTHNVSEEYDNLWDNMWDSDIGKKIWTFDNKNHIYRKVFRVDN